MVRLGPLASAITIVLAIALLMGGLVKYVRADADARLRAEIDADLAAARIADAVLPAVQAMTALEEQSTDGFEYLVIDPLTRAKIDGTLSTWPREVPDAEGWIISQNGKPPRRMIARMGKLDGYFPVLIGRRAGAEGLREWALLGVAALALLVFGVSLFAAWCELSRTERRLQHIDRQLRAFGNGDIKARIEDRGRDIVTQAARQMDMTLDRLAEMIRGKHLLAQRTAHELRNPVALAITLLNVVDTRPRAVADARRAIRQLEATVNAILKLEEVGTRTLNYDHVDLAPAVAGVLDEYTDLAIARNQSFARDLQPAALRGDADLLQQLVANLVSNATKYSPRGSTIETSTGTEGDTVFVRVTDQGVGTRGLPADAGAYHARGSSAQGVDGSGLGLAGARRIAERHGGAIRFADRQNGSGLVVDVRFLALNGDVTSEK